MGNNKNLKDNVNTKFFEIPKRSLKDKLITFKYHMNAQTISLEQSELFLCNKTSEFDKNFINNAMEGNFVYLKDTVIHELYDNTLSLKDEHDIYDEVKKLKELGVSIVVFPENHLTIFGEFAKLPNHVATFLLAFEMTIKFINLIGTYFIHPVWARAPRVCDTKLEQRFSFPVSDQKVQIRLDNIDKINKLLPSSASTYAKKFPIYLRTNNCAEGLERILYACPNCNSFFTLHSEFNCIKCSNCGSALEMSNINCEISLTRTYSSLDEAKVFQFNELSSKDLPFDKEVITYNSIQVSSSKTKNKNEQKNAILTIFPNKISYKIGDLETIIPFEMVFEFYFEQNNTLCVNVFDAETQGSYIVSFVGNSRENLFITMDLFELFKTKTTTAETLNVQDEN